MISLTTALPRDVDASDAVFLVGGAVRDHVLGHPFHDYDIVVQGDAGAFSKKLSRKLNGTLFTMGKGEKASHRIVSGDDVVDVTAMSGKTIEEDLRRRDFTVNAMGYDLRTGDLIDPLGGRKDLASGVLRLANKEAFAEDPLRMLRAFRFSADFGFSMTPKTMSALEKNCGRIAHVAGERIRTELFHIMDRDHSISVIKTMAETGLLTGIIPELDAIRGCHQNRFHSQDVFDHTMDVYTFLENILVHFRRLWRPVSGEIANYLDRDRHRILLKWAALCHDLGKPACRRADGKGGATFHGHEKESARQALNVCQRLKMSHRDTAFVTGIVGDHLRPLFLFNAYRKGELRSKANTDIPVGFLRLAKKHKEDTIGLFIHSLADQQSKSGVDAETVQAFISFSEMVLKAYFLDLEPRMQTSPFLSGHDVMAAFDLKPSRQVGEVLKRLQDAQIAGEITNRDEALDVAARFVRDTL